MNKIARGKCKGVYAESIRGVFEGWAMHAGMHRVPTLALPRVQASKILSFQALHCAEVCLAVLRDCLGCFRHRDRRVPTNAADRGYLERRWHHEMCEGEKASRDSLHVNG